ncbi:uncharacterized protein BO95DRAFT_430649 [Aspergillus brunneoviolaceus CBS 621.78]|uniref:Uncharacterized protein n=1 Tax=Aspergillus brunneoviolaceus CBS 621.78 TaxID=1450534 RepID=A0ACD1GD18_9EURO|nr:hypothetical protein BO95DRAFT_430649 [Aspergillus brunneoviolaceus CBS 621.78]RAH47058.1 hypothetical protein BO95DRAFT_430649 [Aspergillus brunneoviolaceus CBS 621.78]
MLSRIDELALQGSHEANNVGYLTLTHAVNAILLLVPYMKETATHILIERKPPIRLGNATPPRNTPCMSADSPPSRYIVLRIGGIGGGTMCACQKSSTNRLVSPITSTPKLRYRMTDPSASPLSKNN